MTILFPLIDMDKNLYVFCENDNPVYNNHPVYYYCKIQKVINPESNDPSCRVLIGSMSYDNKKWFKLDPMVTAYFRNSKIIRVNHNSDFNKECYAKTFPSKRTLPAIQGPAPCPQYEWEN